MPDEAKALLQQAILPLFAAPLDGRLIHLGSCCVVCTLGRQALLFSAAHVVRQALVIDEIREIHHPSTLPEFRVLRSKGFQLRSTRLLALYRDGVAPAQFADIFDVSISDPSDLAVLSALFPDHVPPETIFRYKVAIDSSPPSPDTPVILAGYGDTDLNVSVDEDRGTSRATFAADR